MTSRKVCNSWHFADGIRHVFVTRNPIGFYRLVGSYKIRSNPISDWITWVGGNATRMATSAPATYQCATSVTGWYAGALPSTVGVTVTAVACFAWTSSICDFHYTIMVTNCNGFYVYLLVAPVCYLWYCSE